MKNPLAWLKSKLIVFWQVFKKSAFKPDYYQTVVQSPFSFSLKYFIFLFFLLGFLTSSALAVFLVQKANPFLMEFKNKLPEFYPAELEIQIKDGKTSTNVSEPYFIALNPDLFPEDIKKGLKNLPQLNLLVIDTSADVADIRKYQTFALLTKTDLVMTAENNEIRAQSLEQIKDFKLDSQQVDQVINNINPFFNKIIPLIILITFIALPLVLIIFNLFYVLIFSSLSLLLAKVMRRQITYAKGLQINLHAITLPTIITAIFQFFGASPKIPFFGTIILTIFNLLIFTSLKEKINKRGEKRN